MRPSARCAMKRMERSTPRSWQPCCGRWRFYFGHCLRACRPCRARRDSAGPRAAAGRWSPAGPGDRLNGTGCFSPQIERRMAVNLTPQYHKAAEQYRRASSAADELKWLEVMLRELPKHKASEKLESDLKQKLSKARTAADAERKASKSTGQGVKIPRQGAGTVVILGGPNAGKSRLLAALTRATPEVAPYPFTTRTPLPGMMPWEDVSVQLIDTPPITTDFMEPYMQGLIRGADLAVLVVDLGADEGIEQLQDLWNRLAATKTRLARQSQLDEEDVGLSFTGTLLAPNKLDLPDAADRLALLHELLPLDLAELPISAEQGTGLDALRRALFAALDVVRVYTKLPTAKAADFEKPFTIRRGRTVLDVAELIHRDFAESFKFARVWGTGVHDGTVVKADYEPHDRDVVEIHA
ncbi:MAG: 50S ribosome-binding GTPase [Pirellulales bacterium]|nr:50S ribosome-binding GTPase [Pirellulales bacterium]